mmetsp:Transcript_4900/g.22144  ORF Transcript_4900/g.22144 Transcript_4900/m.22144 type:complete len:428 (+) Transcript_4900:521-1804(+)
MQPPVHSAEQPPERGHVAREPLDVHRPAVLQVTLVLLLLLDLLLEVVDALLVLRRNGRSALELILELVHVLLRLRLGHLLGLHGGLFDGGFHLLLCPGQLLELDLEELRLLLQDVRRHPLHDVVLRRLHQQQLGPLEAIRQVARPLLRRLLHHRLVRVPDPSVLEERGDALVGEPLLVRDLRLQLVNLEQERVHRVLGGEVHRLGVGNFPGGRDHILWGGSGNGTFPFPGLGLGLVRVGLDLGRRRRGIPGEGDGSLGARVQEAEQVLDPLAVLRLLNLELIVLRLELEQSLALLEEVRVRVTQRLLQVSHLVGTLLEFPLRLMQLRAADAHRVDALHELVTLALEVIDSIAIELHQLRGRMEPAELLSLGVARSLHGCPGRSAVGALRFPLGLRRRDGRRVRSGHVGHHRARSPEGDDTGVRTFRW